MSNAWQPPEYDEIHIRPGYTDSECDRCGVLVINFIKHNQHHYNLDQLRNGLVSLTRAVFGDALPEGAILQEAVSLISGGQGGQAGAVATDGTVAGGGAGQPSAFPGGIGHGGQGNDPTIPECPICGAVGGGGHGGGCPNRDIDDSVQWIREL